MVVGDECVLGIVERIMSSLKIAIRCCFEFTIVFPRNGVEAIKCVLRQIKPVVRERGVRLIKQVEIGLYVLCKEFLCESNIYQFLNLFLITNVLKSNRVVFEFAFYLFCQFGGGSFLGVLL